jgi:hypothetical protein
VINLGVELSDWTARFERVAEIVGVDDEARASAVAAGRPTSGPVTSCCTTLAAEPRARRGPPNLPGAPAHRPASLSDLPWHGDCVAVQAFGNGCFAPGQPGVQIDFATVFLEYR